nr:nucleoside recognition domain-containing protein [Psychrobacter sp. YGAH215]
MIEPIFAPIGFTWQMCIALIPGLAAREVVIAALGTVYAVGNVGDEAVNQTLIPIIHTQWGLATAFSFLAFYVYAPICLRADVFGHASRYSPRNQFFETNHRHSQLFIRIGLFNGVANLSGDRTNFRILER